MAASLNYRRVVAASLTCVLALLAAAAGASGPLAVEGWYTKADAKHTVLEIRAEEGGYLVRLVGGAPVGAAAASPADCYIQAQGRLIDGRILARFAPFRNDVFDFDAAAAQRETRYIELAFPTGRAEVTRVDVAGYCAPGSQFLGDYIRTMDQPR